MHCSLLEFHYLFTSCSRIKAIVKPANKLISNHPKMGYGLDRAILMDYFPLTVKTPGEKFIAYHHFISYGDTFLIAVEQ